MDDDKIVELYLMRDESAIRLTAKKYGTRIRKIAYDIIEDEHYAEECENDTYIKAWNSIPPHEPRNYLFAFLARITRHTALDVCKEQNRIKRNALLCELNAEMEQCIPSPDDGECTLDSILFSDIINKFLASLKDEHRNVFVRRYWYMDSISSISRYYGMSQSKVKSILFRTRNQLRDYLIKEGYNL